MSNWKFSWGPFYAEHVPVFDPPHGDYYSMPSQPKYEAPCGGMTGAEIIERDRAAMLARLITDRYSDPVVRARAGDLVRQAYQEPYARAHYFWLGHAAENF